MFYYGHSDIEVPDTDGYTENFVGLDIYGPRIDKSLMAPKDMDRLFLDKTVDDSDGDKSGNWTINTAKSYKLCTSVGNCVFNTHFFRNF